MTRPRTNHRTSKTPKLTGGDDETRTAPCDRALVDAVWSGGAHATLARPTLLELCGTCSLRPECWADKTWRDALRGRVA